MRQSRYLRIPRPTRFFGVMSLCTGVEMISLATIFNKLTGFYGLLAILTGLHLSPLQISMYIYSCVALVVLALLIPHIRRRSPFQCLLLAYFYLFDTIINTGFTCAFALTWFVAVSSATHNPKGVHGIDILTTIDHQKHNISGVQKSAPPVNSVLAAQKTVAYSVTSAMGAGFEEMIPSVALVAALTIIRFYFVFVMLANARQVLRQNYFLTASSTKLHVHTDGCMDAAPEENPFALGQPAGSGWKGKLGRAMLRIAEEYWLGEPTVDDLWAKGLDGRFKSSKFVTGPPGTIERERRARSGTGPPTPPSILKL
ncbi:hypothetical protein K3495_g4119 [Podosphaera aphanis]|nr:hypothetical protein K3495_g4119 [Podosphaera aphanis]